MAFSSGASNQRWLKARGLRLTRPRTTPRLRNNSRHRAVDPRKLHIRRRGVTQFKAEESLTSKEQAELLFKSKRLSGGPRSIPEYEQRARAERAKIAKLRVLRLAREAALATEKRTPQKSSRTLRVGTRCKE